MSHPSDESIVLVGRGAVLPTPSGSDPWTVFLNGVDAGSDLPEERLRLRGRALHRWRSLGLEMPRSWRGYTAALPEWDPALAGECGSTWSGADADGFDRSVRYALAASFQAWSSAEMDLVDRRRVACILGSIALPTEATAALSERAQVVPLLRQLGLPVGQTRPSWHAANHWAMSLPVLAIADALGLGGDLAGVDAACASSLYAVSRGCDLLRRGVADAVLVGGTSGADRLYTQLGFSALQALSRSGRCSPFDQRADGLVVGEGAAVFVLKRETDALRHGDRVLARVAGCGLSNDREGGLLAPSAEGQLRALRAAYREAGIAPQEVDLIECHATGTPLGDAVEVASLSRLLAGRHPRRPITLGAAKGNVGHLLTGAGAAGLFRSLLALEHRTLPPVANFEQARDKLGIEHGPLRILREAEPWEEPRSRPRRAAVSAFGFGGINAHVVLEEWRDSTSQQRSRAIALNSPESDGRPVIEPADEKEVSASPSRTEKRSGERAREVVVTGLAARLGNAQDSQARAWLLWNQEPPDWSTAVEELVIDLQRYRIPPRELSAAMGQQLIALELARAALIDSGALEEGAQRDAHWLRDGDRSGVFVACDLDPSTNDFAGRWAVGAQVLDPGTEDAQAEDADLASWIDEVSPPLDADRTLGSLGGIVASRVAREFGCGGPSYVIASGGLSGLQAVDAAADALRSGQIDRAIVIGVDLARDARQETLRGLSTAYGSPESCRPLVGGSRNAFASDQAVAIVLESAPQVARERSTYGQLEVVEPGSTAIEAASGTNVAWYESAASGDPRRDAGEFGALHVAETLGRGVGTVQGRVGLAEAVGGLVGLYRALLGARAGRLPETLELGAGPQLLLTPGSAKAAVGFSCVYAGHRQILVEEPAPDRSRPAADARALGLGLESGLFLLESTTPEELAAELAALRRSIDARSEPRAATRAAHWNRLRQRVDGSCRRLAFVARSVGELESTVSRLEALVAERGDLAPELLPNGVQWANRDADETPKVAFVYPGSGQLASWQGAPVLEKVPGVVRGLRSRHPELAMVVESGDGSSEDGAVASQILRQVSTSLALHELLSHCGVVPDAVLGYSVGETAALLACRVWRDVPQLLTRMRESGLFRDDLAGEHRAARAALGWPAEAAFEWSVGVVSAAPATIRTALAEDGVAARSVRLLVINSDHECLVGGERQELADFSRRHSLQLHGLSNVAAVHSDLASPCAGAYRAFHSLECSPGRVAVYGTASGVPYSPTQQTCAESLTRQAVEGFDFRTLIRNAWRDGHRVFVEVGPGTSCTRMIRSILADELEQGSGLVQSLSRDSGCGERDLLGLLASLWVRGVPCDLEAVLAAPRAEELGAHLRTVPVRRSIDASVLASKISLASNSGQSIGSEADSGSVASAQESPLHAGEGASLDPEPSLAQTGPVDTPAGSGTLGPVEPPRRLDRAACLQFARGELEPLFGRRFAGVDAFPTRVRLPDEPLMLVDRILTIEGEPLSLQAGRVVTEHDVLVDGWYLDEGVLPTAIAVESGQADLLLSGFLGIDFETRGVQRYRLLDAVVTFHDALPEAGQVVRYDIRIDHFFRQGANWLFRFGFEATVDGRPLLTMRDGCAGFFSQEDLAAGRGIVRARLDLQGERDREPDQPLLDWTEDTLDRDGVEAVLAGDLGRAFGAPFRDLAIGAPSTLPGGQLDLVDRVTRMERRGGRFGLGLVEAEHDVAPDAWFLTCHFVDDQVMPGTLMYECCLHALRVFLLRSGWVAPSGSVRWQPVPGISSRLRCRGQVTAETRVAGYRVEIKELGERPQPYVVADATLLADGREIVSIHDLTLQLSGTTMDELRNLWRGTPQRGAAESGVPDPDAAHAAGGEGRAAETSAIEAEVEDALALAPAIYDRSSIEEFASGRPSLAFGEPYLPFDSERRIARLPRDPYQFLDAITEVEGDPFVLEAGARCVAQWRLRADDWFFAANRQPNLPFAVLLEAALQPCGWLAAYCGSALTSGEDLSFRNLGGDAVLHALPPRRDDLLSTEVELTRTSASGGMIIQHFSLSVSSVELGPVYSGTTYFGFFPAQALANQVGLRDCELWPGAQMLPPGKRLPTDDPFPDDQWRMVDRIVSCAPDGGEHGHGHVRGTIDVDPSAWFFEAHFFEDPVWPGSLGLEAVLQLLRYWVREQAVAHGGPAPQRFDAGVLEHRHRWSYRGQIVPRDRMVTVEASIRSYQIDPHSGEGHVTADGIVEVDGRVIYRLLDFAVGFGQGTPLRNEDSP